MAKNLFKASNIPKIPASIDQMRKFLKAVSLKDLQAEIEQELGVKVAIVGRANTGKSTLFNTLKGQMISPASPEAGTTVSLIEGAMGPFSFIDTPGHLPDIAMMGVARAGVIVLLLDVIEGLTKQDKALFKELKATEKPLIVALNKIDLVKKNIEPTIADIEAELDVPVIPISAKTGANIATDLMPEIIDANPEIAVVIGRQLPNFRRDACKILIRNAATLSLAAGMEPIPLLDIPILLGTQVRLVLRIGTIYGEPTSGKYLRELAVTLVGGLFFRYLAEQAAKAVPFGGDLVSGVIAAAATWSIGQVAVEYFESGKTIPRKRLRQLYKQLSDRFMSAFRKEKTNPNLAMLPPGDLVRKAEQMVENSSGIQTSFSQPTSERSLPSAASQ